jgi:hypothetical protein
MLSIARKCPAAGSTSSQQRRADPCRGSSAGRYDRDGDTVHRAKLRTAPRRQRPGLQRRRARRPGGLHAPQLRRGASSKRGTYCPAPRSLARPSTSRCGPSLARAQVQGQPLRPSSRPASPPLGVAGHPAAVSRDTISSTCKRQTASYRAFSIGAAPEAADALQALSLYDTYRSDGSGSPGATLPASRMLEAPRRAKSLWSKTRRCCASAGRLSESGRLRHLASTDLGAGPRDGLAFAFVCAT